MTTEHIFIKGSHRHAETNTQSMKSTMMEQDNHDLIRFSTPCGYFEKRASIQEHRENAALQAAKTETP
jgi:hypothetical protein